MEKISIITPVYNCEKYLRHTIESVINQTYPNWELIIIDDASTDNSLQEAMRYAKQDKRIQVHQYIYNQGVSICRNTGIKNATGDYVAFLDADDLWAADKLEKQLAFMKTHNADFSHTAYAFMNDDGEVMKKGKAKVSPVVGLKDYMKTTQIGMSSVMYNRRHIPDLRFPSDRMLCEDARVWMHYMRKGYHFYGLNQVLSLYRIRPHQLSHNKFKMATNTLRRYIAENNVPQYKKLFYFINYAYNGIKKRLRPSQLDMQEIYQNFNCYR